MPTIEDERLVNCDIIDKEGKMPTIEDERLVTAVVEHMRSFGLYTISPAQFDWLAHEMGYIDGPRFVRYLKTPEGRAFFDKMWKRKKVPKKVPERYPELSEEQKKRVVAEFEEIMGRKPTVAEMVELFREEKKLKRRVPV